MVKERSPTPSGCSTCWPKPECPRSCGRKENCREQRRIVGAPAARIVSEKYVGGPHGRFERADGQLLPAYAFTITPSAMPKGARFVISAGRLPASERHNPRYVGPWIDWALVPAGVSVTCGPAVPPEVG